MPKILILGIALFIKQILLSDNTFSRSVGNNFFNHKFLATE